MSQATALHSHRLRFMFERIGNGTIRCPFCRKLHRITRGQIKNLPTKQLEWKKISVN